MSLSGWIFYKAISLRVKEISSKILVTTIDSNAIDFRIGIEGIKELETIKQTDLPVLPVWISSEFRWKTTRPATHM